MKILQMRKTDFIFNDAETLIIRQFDKFDDDKPSAVLVVPAYAREEFIKCLMGAIDLNDTFDLDDELDIGE